VPTVTSVIGIGDSRELYAAVAREPDGWRIIHADATIETEPSAELAMRRIAERARNGNPGCTIVRVTWFNVPEDFQPPRLTFLLTSKR
jgi:hypothetical protein